MGANAPVRRKGISVLGDRRFHAPPYRSRAVRLGALVGMIALGLTAGPTMARPDRPAGDGVVEGSYIVTLQPGNDPRREAPGLAAQHGGRARHIYEHVLNGFSFEGSEQGAAGLARNPKVRTVVPDRPVEATAQTVPTGISRIEGNLSGTVSGNGSGAVDVDIAILDTGIDVDHPDLNVFDGVNCSTGDSYDDRNGHGTHVAGTAAAKDNDTGVVGVAPGARLWAVRVLGDGGSGTWASVICGINWVTPRAGQIEVANMSLGGASSASTSCNDGGLRQAICESVGSGVTYAVAAGNSEINVANYVPAAFPEVITVSALADFNGLPGGGAQSTCRADQDDTIADFSNYGDGVDLIAPGVCIYSTWMDGGYNEISGTSMATPHVAGAAALYRSDHAASPSQVKAELQKAGNADWIATDDRDEIHETLLNVDALVGTTIGGGTPPPPAPPPPSSPIALSARGYKIKGWQYVDLTWSGATKAVDVYRNGSRVKTNIANDRAETDSIGKKGSGTYNYRICETGATTTCSNTVTVTF